MNNALVDALIEEDNENGLTENGAKTFKSSLSANLDLFFSIGTPTKDEQTLLKMFTKAYLEDSETALKIVLWSRDCRGGAGIRKNFLFIAKHLASKNPKVAAKLLEKIPELGRYDDMFKAFHGTPLWDEVVNVVADGLTHENGLLAKWMDRKGIVAHDLRQALGMSPKEYRKTIVSLSNTVEQKMCANEWNEIDYEHVPSVAFARNKNAFGNHDRLRFNGFLESVSKGEKKINASVVYPHDVYRSLRSGFDHTAADLQWKALPNYLEGNKERIMVMADVSGSMDTPISGSIRAIDVCVSLTLYISERMEGDFKDTFISFSSNPQMYKVTGDLSERLEQIESSSWGMTTNLQSAFDLILNTAISHKIPKNQMPSMILIMSDMEFDAANDGQTNFQTIQAKYKKYHYTMPKIVFWNLNSRQGNNVPALKNQKNVAMISGFSPAILTSIVGTGTVDPLKIMHKAINSPRYEI